MQQEFNSSVWLSPNDSRSFLIIKFLLGCLITSGLLGITLPHVRPKKVEASVITSLESAKLVVASEAKNQDRQEKAAETVTVEQQQLELKLKDAVVLALQNNRNIKNAYLQRIIDRENLEQEEHKFVPDFIPQVAVSFRRNELGSSTNTGDLELGTGVSVIIPTGAEIRLDLTSVGQIQSTSTNSEDFLEQNFSVSFNQPLLQRFGSDINKASIKIARLEEEQNLFQLKSTLIDTISNAVIDYRALVQAQEELKIQQRALLSAKRQL